MSPASPGICFETEQGFDDLKPRPTRTLELYTGVMRKGLRKVLCFRSGFDCNTRRIARRLPLLNKLTPNQLIKWTLSSSDDNKFQSSTIGMSVCFPPDESADHDQAANHQGADCGCSLLSTKPMISLSPFARTEFWSCLGDSGFI